MAFGKAPRRQTQRELAREEGDTTPRCPHERRKRHWRRIWLSLWRVARPLRPCASSASVLCCVVCVCVRVPFLFLSFWGWVGLFCVAPLPAQSTRRGQITLTARPRAVKRAGLRPRLHTWLSRPAFEAAVSLDGHMV